MRTVSDIFKPRIETMNSARILLGIACLIIGKVDNVFGSVCQRPPEKHFSNNTVNACDPRRLIYDHEGCKECVYLDTKGIKTIAVGLNLRRSDAPSILASVGANYSAIVNGPVTAVKTPCDCSKVTCLTQVQINKILEITIKIASRDAQSLISSFAR